MRRAPELFASVLEFEALIHVFESIDLGDPDPQCCDCEDCVSDGSYRRNKEQHRNSMAEAKKENAPTVKMLKDLLKGPRGELAGIRAALAVTDAERSVRPVAHMLKKRLSKGPD